jgi:hypothetical protein
MDGALRRTESGRLRIVGSILILRLAPCDLEWVLTRHPPRRLRLHRLCPGVVLVPVAVVVAVVVVVVIASRSIPRGPIYCTRWDEAVIHVRALLHIRFVRVVRRRGKRPTLRLRLIPLPRQAQRG